MSTKKATRNMDTAKIKIVSRNVAKGTAMLSISGKDSNGDKYTATRHCRLMSGKFSGVSLNNPMQFAIFEPTE